MWRFIRHYALEIYTVLAVLLLVGAAMMGELSVVQKLVVVDTFLFILHEWEESRFPRGMFENIGRLFYINISKELKRAVHIPAGIALLFLSVVPFVFDKTPMITIALATFGIMEALVHTVGIRVFHTKKFYTPGMITAWMEVCVSVILITYLVYNRLGNWYDYLLGPILTLLGFGIFQKTMSHLLGVRYRDMIRCLVRQWRK